MTTITIATLSVASTALVTASQSIDRAVRRAEGPKAAWSNEAATLLLGGTDFSEVETAMLESVRSVAPKRVAAKLERVSHLARFGFSTAYGWLKDLQRVHEAGLSSLLLSSETGNNGKAYSLTELRRGTDPRQPKAGPERSSKGNRSKATTVASGKGSVAASVTEPSAPVTMTLSAVADFMEAEAKRRSAKSLADQDQGPLGRIAAATATMTRMVEAHVAAKAAARAAKRAAAPKGKRARKAA